jgi:hypothetical protein
MNQQQSQHEHEEDDAADAFCREVLRAGTAGGDTIAAAAEAPFLFQRIRARIAAEAESRAAANTQCGVTASLLSRLAGWPTPRWAVAAIAVLIALLAWAVPLNWTRGSREIAGPAAGAPEIPAREKSSAPDPAPPGLGRPANPAARRAARVRRVDEPEIATAFLPLTIVLNDDAQESGQIIRMQAPRSALLALGLPVQDERSEDMVKADVIIGDDGLARAIRFVR